jgi:hypothetical protein
MIMIMTLLIGDIKEFKQRLISRKHFRNTNEYN